MVPPVRRTRTVSAPAEEVWEVVADPEHLPRWWPLVERVEGVEDGRWTTVLRTPKGRPVRADYRLVEWSEPSRLVWAQEVAGTPFEGVVADAETEILLAPGEDDVAATRVTIELRQRMRGLARLGRLQVRRAAGRQLDEALDRLELACGG